MIEAPAEAVRKLIAIARGEWGDPDRKPVEEPWGSCDWGDCEVDAVAWRWDELSGGWLPVCAAHCAP